MYPKKTRDEYIVEIVNAFGVEADRVRNIFSSYDSYSIDYLNKEVDRIQKNLSEIICKKCNPSLRSCSIQRFKEELDFMNIMVKDFGVSYFVCQRIITELHHKK
ncbi:MAG: hypothetical protein FWG98_13345 [Candidatus Cloacimonetes bacterium]|nr:hypothetical protein [Candidatus Cloacimonadota bacterium]